MRTLNEMLCSELSEITRLPIKNADLIKYLSKRSGFIENEVDNSLQSYMVMTDWELDFFLNQFDEGIFPIDKLKIKQGIFREPTEEYDVSISKFRRRKVEDQIERLNNLINNNPKGLDYQTVYSELHKYGVNLGEITRKLSKRVIPSKREVFYLALTLGITRDVILSSFIKDKQLKKIPNS